MLRSDLWVSAFVRRHNNLGHICVVSRRGDAVAGQIFIEIDHLNGQVSLLTFTRFEKNPSMPADQFKFTPPKGADVFQQ